MFFFAFLERNDIFEENVWFKRRKAKRKGTGVVLEIHPILDLVYVCAIQFIVVVGKFG